MYRLRLIPAARPFVSAGQLPFLRQWGGNAKAASGDERIKSCEVHERTREEGRKEVRKERWKEGWMHERTREEGRREKREERWKEG